MSQSLKCRRCRKVHSRESLHEKPARGGWARDLCCPSCGCKTFTEVKEQDKNGAT